MTHPSRRQGTTDAAPTPPCSSRDSSFSRLGVVPAHRAVKPDKWMPDEARLAVSRRTRLAETSHRPRQAAGEGNASTGPVRKLCLMSSLDRDILDGWPPGHAMRQTTSSALHHGFPGPTPWALRDSLRGAHVASGEQMENNDTSNRAHSACQTPMHKFNLKWKWIA